MEHRFYLISAPELKVEIKLGRKNWSKMAISSVGEYKEEKLHTIGSSDDFRVGPEIEATPESIL